MDGEQGIEEIVKEIQRLKVKAKVIRDVDLCRAIGWEEKDKYRISRIMNHDKLRDDAILVRDRLIEYIRNHSGE